MTPTTYNQRLLKAKDHALQTLEALCDPLPTTLHDASERRLAIQDRANRIRAANDILRCRPVNEDGHPTRPPKAPPQDPAPTDVDAPPPSADAQPQPQGPAPEQDTVSPPPRPARHPLPPRPHPFDGIEGWNNGQGNAPCILTRFPRRSSRAP